VSGYRPAESHTEPPVPASPSAPDIEKDGRQPVPEGQLGFACVGIEPVHESGFHPADTLGPGSETRYRLAGASQVTIGCRTTCKGIRWNRPSSRDMPD
jgi:hypothetical protein